MFKTEKARELFSQLLDVNWKIDNKIINTETLAYIAEIIQKMAVV